MNARSFARASDYGIQQVMSTPPLPAPSVISTDFLSMYIEERNRFEEDDTGKVAPPLPRGLVIDGPALLEAMQTPDSQGALLRAAQVQPPHQH